MESVVAEKKQSEGNNGDSTIITLSVLDSSSSLLSYNSPEAPEFRERQARDLKAGLHPLKVPLSLSLSLFLSQSMID